MESRIAVRVLCGKEGVREGVFPLRDGKMPLTLGKFRFAKADDIFLLLLHLLLLLLTVEEELGVENLSTEVATLEKAEDGFSVEDFQPGVEVKLWGTLQGNSKLHQHAQPKI